MQRPARHLHELRTSLQRLEQGPFRASHDGGQAQGRDLVEQGRAPPRIQVRRGLVQQQDGRRRPKRLRALQPRRLGQDQVQRQGLLLARRPLGGGPVLLAVQGGQIAAMRSVQRSPGRLRTASSPLRTLMESAPYSGEAAVSSVMKSSVKGPASGTARGGDQAARIDPGNPSVERLEI